MTVVRLLISCTNGLQATWSRCIDGNWEEDVFSSLIIIITLPSSTVRIQLRGVLCIAGPEVDVVDASADDVNSHAGATRGRCGQGACHAGDRTIYGDVDIIPPSSTWHQSESRTQALHGQQCRRRRSGARTLGLPFDACCHMGYYSYKTSCARSGRRL